MAQMTLSIGPLTSSKTATDANAQRVLESAFALFHDELDEFTNQEKLDYIAQTLIPMMLTDRARQYEERQAILDAEQSVIDDPPLFV